MNQLLIITVIIAGLLLAACTPSASVETAQQEEEFNHVIQQPTPVPQTEPLIEEDVEMVIGEQGE